MVTILPTNPFLAAAAQTPHPLPLNEIQPNNINENRQKYFNNSKPILSNFNHMQTQTPIPQKQQQQIVSVPVQTNLQSQLHTQTTSTKSNPAANISNTNSQSK